MHLGHPLENTAPVFLSTRPKHGVGFINKGSCASENLGSMAPVNGGSRCRKGSSGRTPTEPRMFRSISMVSTLYLRSGAS